MMNNVLERETNTNTFCGVILGQLSKNIAKLVKIIIIATDKKGTESLFVMIQIMLYLQMCTSGTWVGKENHQPQLVKDCDLNRCGKILQQRYFQPYSH